MQKAKLVVIAILSIVAIVVVLQNLQTVQARFLFLTIKAPQAVLLFLTLALGFALGVLTWWLVRSKPWTSASAAGEKHP